MCGNCVKNDEIAVHVLLNCQEVVPNRTKYFGNPSTLWEVLSIVKSLLVFLEDTNHLFPLIRKIRALSEYQRVEMPHLFHSLSGSGKIYIGLLPTISKWYSFDTPLKSEASNSTTASQHARQLTI